MSAIPDDLDKLLDEVKKTIDSNLKFLKSLSGDDEHSEVEVDGDDVKVEDDEEFVEL